MLRSWLTVHACMQAAAVGSSPLALALLGPWTKAPKQARDDYERFIRSVSRLLGGEAPFEEVQVSSGKPCTVMPC